MGIRTNFDADDRVELQIRLDGVLVTAQINRLHRSLFVRQRNPDPPNVSAGTHVTATQANPTVATSVA